MLVPEQPLIAEQVILLMVAPGPRHVRFARPNILIGGALLTELGVLGAVDIEPDRQRREPRRVRVLPGAMPDDPILSALVDKIAERPQTPGFLGMRLGEAAHDALFARLVDRGTLHEVESGRLLKKRGWSVGDPARIEKLHDAIGDAIVRRRPHDERSAALIGLLSGARSTGLISFEGVPQREIRRRARAIRNEYMPTGAGQEVVRAAQRAAARARGSDGGD